MPFLHILKKGLYLYICVAFWLLWYIIIDFLLLNQCLDCLQRWLEHSSHPLYSFAVWLCHWSPQKVESPSPWICFGLCFVLLECGRGNTVISDPWPQGFCSFALSLVEHFSQHGKAQDYLCGERGPESQPFQTLQMRSQIRESGHLGPSSPPLNSQLTAAMKVTRARPAQPTHGIVRKNKLCKPLFLNVVILVLVFCF